VSYNKTSISNLTFMSLEKKSWAGEVLSSVIPNKKIVAIMALQAGFSAGCAEIIGIEPWEDPKTTSSSSSETTSTADSSTSTGMGGVGGQGGETATSSSSGMESSSSTDVSSSSSASTGTGGPTCPTNGNLLFTGESCYEYEVYRGGVFLPPPQASDPDATCVSTDCSVDEQAGDKVLVWNSTNTVSFDGNDPSSVDCKCSTYSLPPQKASIVVELNTAPLPTTITNSGSGLNHKYVVSTCPGAVACMINE